MMAGTNLGLGKLTKALERTTRGGDPYCVLEEVTPEQAKEWLALNKKNRGLSDPWVKSLARDITRGRWVIDGNPIRLSSVPELLDGQHRLHAVILADKPIRTFVVYNLPPVAMDNIDRGRTRTVSDLFKINGITSEYTRASSICLHLMTIQVGNANHGKLRISYTEARDIYEQEKEDIDWAIKKVGSVIEPGVPNGGSPTLAALAYMRPVNIAKVEAFAHRFKTGQGTKPGDPAEALRRQCANFQRSSEGIRRTFVLRTLRAVEAALTGEKLSHLKVDGNIIKRARELRGEA